MNARHIAYGFASALDRTDYESAARYLSPRCDYNTGKEWLVGRDEVILSYQANNARAKQKLEQIDCSSKITYVNGRTAVIQSVDEVTHKGETHQYLSNQKLTLNDEGYIVRIEQKEISGQREHLYDFYGRVGVDWL